MKVRLLVSVFALVVAACSGSSTDDTTTTTRATTTSEATTTTVEGTTTTTEETTTTTEETTTTTEETTTTTVSEDSTTTTSEGEDTTTTTEGDTTTTSEATEETTTTTSFPPPPTTSSTTIAAADPDLEQWAGIFRQPTAFPNFVQFRADGVLRAGSAFDSMPFEGTWDYDADTATFVVDIDVGGTTCDGATGTYARSTAPGGGRTLTLVDDPCEDRVQFFTLPGSPCACMTWLEVVEPEPETTEG
jgi:hypothetical protein